VVGSMNLRVAVQTCAAEQKPVAEVIGDVIATVGYVGMTRGRMALLAKQGGKFGQQHLVIASMRPVTQCAVFTGRCVLPKEGPALFRVAGVAGFVDGRFLQQKVVGTVVRVMATTATHFSESKGVAAGFESISSALLVAVKTGFLLGQGVEHPVARPVDLVTGSTAYLR